MTASPTTTTTPRFGTGSHALRMKIDDVFHITGRGVVAVGVIEAGTASTGDDVQITENGATIDYATISGVEMLRRLVDTATVGDHVGLLLRGVTQDDLRRGMVIVGREPVSDKAPFSNDAAGAVSAVDTLSSAAASAADHKDFTQGREFRGLGFTDDSTPGHVGSSGGMLKGLVIVAAVLGALAAAGRMAGWF